MRLLIYDEFIPISIHAPLAGSDPRNLFPLLRRRYFNPRSPRGERRRCPSLSGHVWLFQSTLPSRGATQHLLYTVKRIEYFNPRSPRGERRYGPLVAPDPGNFNPRSPRGERLLWAAWTPARARFQSTLPSRGATTAWAHSLTNNKFQSTLPSRGATVRRRASKGAHGISIHAPLAGSDSETAQRHRYVL